MKRILGIALAAAMLLAFAQPVLAETVAVDCRLLDTLEYGYEDWYGSPSTMAALATLELTLDDASEAFRLAFANALGESSVPTAYVAKMHVDSDDPDFRTLQACFFMYDTLYMYYYCPALKYAAYIATEAAVDPDLFMAGAQERAIVDEYEEVDTEEYAILMYVLLSAANEEN